VKNQEISNIFRQIAEILEIKGANRFRVNAYERAARNIEAIPEDIGLFMKGNRLRTIPGIGRELEKKIKEIVLSGGLNYLEELKKEVPEGLIDMLNVPGIGPKTVRLLHERLGIQDLVMLERMAHAGRIKGLPGMKEKTEENIIRGIELLKRGRDRMDLKTAAGVADAFINRLKRLNEVEDINPAGSLRRMKDTVRDIDILISSKKAEKVMDTFTDLSDVKDIVAKGPTKSSVITKDGIHVDVRVVENSSYGAALMYFTGSKAHNIKLRQLAIKHGLKLNEYGVFKGKKRIAGKTEEEMYKRLKLPYIIPELREDRGELEAAIKGRLPRPVGLEDIKGDLHTHSRFSDGASSIEELVLKAGRLGYEYIAVTDHSQGLKIAGGLDRMQLKAKMKEIERIRRKYGNIKILFGTEVDIGFDGALDYPDDILKEMDLVIGAIHSGFKQSRQRLTRRIIKACQNKYVNIIAHPTGRLWGAREPYEIELEEILRVARETHTALEINSFPQRLDLNDINCRTAKDFGVRLTINTDAHSADQLEMMKFGVSVALRGWLEKTDILNTLPFKKLNSVLTS